MEIGNATARLNSQTSVSSDFASSTNTPANSDPAQTQIASQTPWVTLVDDSCENSLEEDLSNAVDAENGCEQVNGGIAYRTAAQETSSRYTTPAIPRISQIPSWTVLQESPDSQHGRPWTLLTISSGSLRAGAAVLRPLTSVSESGLRAKQDHLVAKLTTLCAEQAQELGYYQGLLAAKQEQLKQVPELRRQAAKGIIAERQLAAARQQISTLESEVSVLKTKPFTRIVNALLTGNDLAPSVQKILLLLILTSSSVITIMLLTGV